MKTSEIGILLGLGASVFAIALMSFSDFLYQDKITREAAKETKTYMTQAFP
jgi:hypothetical protein